MIELEMTDQSIGTPPAVRFKGWRGGLLLGIGPGGTWPELLSTLRERLGVTRDFWDGAPATIDLGNREVSSQNLEELLDLLAEEFRVEPIAVISIYTHVRETAIRRGLEASATIPIAEPKPVLSSQGSRSSTFGAAPPKEETRYLKGTVRSGIVVESPGNLVIVGDVNAGAALRANGDIVVLGTLRGVAHAGINGNLEAQILAINLRPTQIRIADLIARSPDDGQPPLSKLPERALVQNGEIHVIPLHSADLYKT